MAKEATKAKWIAAVAIAASLVIGAAAGVSAAASPAQRATRDRLACSVAANGGKPVDGVCVLPGTNVGQIYEAFIITTRGDGGHFDVTAGGLPPGTSMPAGTARRGQLSVGRRQLRADSPLQSGAPTIGDNQYVRPTRSRSARLSRSRSLSPPDAATQDWSTGPTCRTSSSPGGSDRSRRSSPRGNFRQA